MIVLVHTLFMGSIIWMTLHFWRQLPLTSAESDAGRVRESIEWAVKGVAVPLLAWNLVNLGLTSWLPPFLPEVDAAKNAGTFSMKQLLIYTSPAMTVITSYWGALSLMTMAFVLHARTEDRSAFNALFLTWSAFLLPVSVITIWIGGWAAAGFALLLWLAPAVHACLPAPFAPKPVPSYSQAIAKIKFGKYSEAEWEVIRELEHCENDFNGWMMLAELYAVHFHDFKQAEQTVIDLCDQPDLSPSDACVALHRLADWCLQLENDPQGARRCMEAIIKRYPGTHLERMARIRLRRIPRTKEEWLDENRTKPLHLPELHEEFEEPEAAPATNVEAVRQQAELMSTNLTRDPNDVSSREEFARLLAKLGRLEAAVEQITLLLEMEGQLESRRAQWMGLKADWMLKLAPQDPEVRKLLRRIIQEFPHSTQAMAAQRRIFHIDEQARVAKYSATPKKPAHSHPTG